jgi:hypothetical protein
MIHAQVYLLPDAHRQRLPAVPGISTLGAVVTFE